MATQASPTSASSRVWFHELAYQASSWSRVRRIVLVVLERPGQLFLDSFYLVTNWSAEQMPAVDLLQFYRERGTMEGHLGELQTVLASALSCTSRPKSRVRGRVPKHREVPRDAEWANAAPFLLYALSYNLANTARRIMSLEAQGRDGPPGASAACGRRSSSSPRAWSSPRAGPPSSWARRRRAPGPRSGAGSAACARSSTPPDPETTRAWSPPTAAGAVEVRGRCTRDPPRHPRARPPRRPARSGRSRARR
ncbi:MAG: transposase [Planctomycetes bacterium]|nr:transposase [Planctomycetota bacterium]